MSKEQHYPPEHAKGEFHCPHCGVYAKQRWSHLSATGEEAKVFLIHEGYAQVSKRRPYYRTPDKIMLITRALPNTLAVGTTKRSVVKFWIGAGVLEQSTDGYVENIYSPNQLEKAKSNWGPANIGGLYGKNFQRIRVVKR